MRMWWVIALWACLAGWATPTRAVSLAAIRNDCARLHDENRDLQRQIERLETRHGDIALLQDELATAEQRVAQLQEDVAELEEINAYLEASAGQHREQMRAEEKKQAADLTVNGVACPNIAKAQVRFHEELAEHCRRVEGAENVVRRRELLAEARRDIDRALRPGGRISRWCGTLETIAVPGADAGVQLAITAEIGGARVEFDASGSTDQRSAVYRALRTLREGQLVEFSGEIVRAEFASDGAVVEMICTGLRPMKIKQAAERPAIR